MNCIQLSGLHFSIIIIQLYFPAFHRDQALELLVAAVQECTKEILEVPAVTCPAEAKMEGTNGNAVPITDHQPEMTEDLFRRASQAFRWPKDWVDMKIMVRTEWLLSVFFYKNKCISEPNTRYDRNTTWQSRPPQNPNVGSSLGSLHQKSWAPKDQWRQEPVVPDR